ncbi:hypothetical protein [Pedobacter sp. R-06]|uniref:hypothetical protein n=1 Tax=Pedobacter sp. R-06 TaxID=3404051 RepID=UPI003CF8AFED
MILVSSFNLKAQDKLVHFDAKLLSRFILNNINHEMIKDSTAVYTFSLKIEIEKKKGIQLVKTNVNNPLISLALDSLNALNKYNYDVYLKNGKAKILMRFYLIALSSDYNPKLVDVHNIPETIKFLFEKGDDTFIDMGAYGITIDKKVYN